ncbi:MAG: serine/threonine-protein kinase [Candidatus Thermoplasmatota archaeon]
MSEDYNQNQMNNIPLHPPPPDISGTETTPQTASAFRGKKTSLGTIVIGISFVLIFSSLITSLFGSESSSYYVYYGNNYYDTYITYSYGFGAICVFIISLIELTGIYYSIIWLKRRHSRIESFGAKYIKYSIIISTLFSMMLGIIWTSYFRFFVTSGYTPSYSFIYLVSSLLGWLLSSIFSLPTCIAIGRGKDMKNVKKIIKNNRGSTKYISFEDISISTGIKPIRVEKHLKRLIKRREISGKLIDDIFYFSHPDVYEYPQPQYNLPPSPGYGAPPPPPTYSPQPQQYVVSPQSRAGIVHQYSDIVKQKVMRKTDLIYEKARRVRLRADDLRDRAKIYRSMGSPRNLKNAELIEYKANALERRATVIDEKARMLEAKYGVVREEPETKATKQAPPPLPTYPPQPHYVASPPSQPQQYVVSPQSRDGIVHHVSSLTQAHEESYNWGDFFSYKLGERIGKGGFGKVHLVERNGRTYAMKIPLDADLGGRETLNLDRSTLKSYVKEAKIWALLTEKIPDGVVNLYDAGIAPFPWFVMEYMPNGSLRTRIERLKRSEAIEITVSVLHILEQAHHRGIAHCDLKPENIFFTADNKLKISDFGLSKIMSKVSKSSDFSSGTLSYAAPEQFASKRFGEKDWRTDIWQVGVLLHEMLTERVPFEGDDISEITYAIINENPPETNLPNELNSVILRALAKRKEDRWQSATEMRMALQEAERGM